MHGGFFLPEPKSPFCSLFYPTKKLKKTSKSKGGTLELKSCSKGPPLVLVLMNSLTSAQLEEFWGVLPSKLLYRTQIAIQLVGRSTSASQPPKTSFIYRFSSTFCSLFQIKHSKTVLKPLPTQETKNLCDVELKWKQKPKYILHDTENSDLLKKTCLQNNKFLIIW